MKRPDPYGLRDGSAGPRRAGSFFDSMALLVLIAGVLIALILAGNGAGGQAVLTGLVALVVAASIHTSAVAMRWMAAMYELASRGFEPVAAPTSEGRPEDLSSGRSHRRAA